jgi:hypothetical protein
MTAGAATALAGSNSAEAAIHYSGLVDEPFRPHSNKIKSFQLDQPGDFFQFAHATSIRTSTIGSAAFRIIGGSAAFRGTVNDYTLVSKLSFGQSIAAGHFVTYSFGEMARSYIGYWGDRGVGFVGFRFNSGAGIQYGWARVRMGGTRRHNGFEVLDYAFADVGEPIFAGQRSSDEQAPDQGSTDEDAPNQGSLGGLALGALGLFAWRKSRSRTAPLADR